MVAKTREFIENKVLNIVDVELKQLKLYLLLHVVTLCFTYADDDDKLQTGLGLELSEDVVVVVGPTPPTCCQQSPAPEIMWQPAVSPPRWQGKAPLCRDSSRGPG